LVNERTFRKNFKQVFGPDTQPTETELAEFWSLIERGAGARVYHKLIGYITDRRRHRERWVNVLLETSVPLRIVNGPEDPVSGIHLVERYRKLVPNPDVVVLDGIGHYPLTEDPAGTLNAFLEFVEGRGKG
jgi:pimeloyl-ACP methyl ester carboxylesterase